MSADNSHSDLRTLHYTAIIAIDCIMRCLYSLSMASLIPLTFPSAFIIFTLTCVPSNTAIAGIKVCNVMHEEAHVHLFIL